MKKNGHALPIAYVPGGDLTVTFRAAAARDLERLVPLMDEEFVFSKGRRISLALRFPTVYCPENVRNIFLAEEGDTILSALATKRFEWLADGRTWSGAMIGAVYTRPQRRREGIASRLLGWAIEKLQQDDLDFAVLWTGRPAIYERLGWIAADCGVLGEIEDDIVAKECEAIADTMPLNAVDYEKVENIRQRWLTALTRRRAEDYRQLPLPAESMSLMHWGEGMAQAGYSLVGCAGELGILYEMVGHPDSFPVLWRTLRRRYRRILVNGRPDTASHDWLVQNASLAWKAKPLAMWRQLSGKTDLAHISNWYIPYFDRI